MAGLRQQQARFASVQRRGIVWLPGDGSRYPPPARSNRTAAWYWAWSACNGQAVPGRKRLAKAWTGPVFALSSPAAEAVCLLIIAKLLVHTSQGFVEISLGLRVRIQSAASLAPRSSKVLTRGAASASPC